MMAQAQAASIHWRIWEFAAAALINIFGFPYAAVCELYPPPDSLPSQSQSQSPSPSPSPSPWDDAQIGHYIGVLPTPIPIPRPSPSPTDNAATAAAARPYLCQADPCTDDLPALLHDQALPLDLVCCFHHFQLCFESEDKARTLLHNVSSLLKPGAYFFGLLPDSSTIWTKYQKNVEASLHKGGPAATKSNVLPHYIRTDNYVITFEIEEDKFPPFGKRYQIKFANEATFDTHCLVHFPSLIRLAREAGLEYIEIQNLTEFYDDNRAQFAGLLSNYAPNMVDPRGKLLPRSFDILGLYSIFVFQKPDPDTAPPLVTPPPLTDEDPSYDEELIGEGYTQAGCMDEEISTVGTAAGAVGVSGISADVGEEEKGILGARPAELR